MPSFAVIALFQAGTGEKLARIRDHFGAAAQHEPIVLERHRWQTDVGEELAGSYQVGDAAGVAERLAGHGGIIDEPVADEFTDEVVLWKHVPDHIAIGELLDRATAVDEHDLFEPLVGFRILDDRQERREAGASAEQVQTATLEKIVDDQRPCRLAADQDRVADLEVLQPATSADHPTP